MASPLVFTFDQELLRTDSMTLDEARLRVAGGAGWLDERAPGWERRCLPLSTLNISRTADCVVGRVLGGFGATPAHSSMFWAADHGFCARWSSRDYGALTVAWCELINARLNAQAQAEREVEVCCA